MWHHAQYFSGGAGWTRVVHYSGASWALGSEKIALCIIFLSVLVLLFSSLFAVLLNCFYPNPQVSPFSSDSPSHSTGRGGGVRERLCGSLLPAGAKPQQTAISLWAALWKDVSPGQYCGSRSTWDIVTFSNPFTNVNYFSFIFYTNLQYSLVAESELGALQLQYISILTLVYARQIILEALVTSKQSVRNLASSAHQQAPNDRTVQPAY